MNESICHICDRPETRERQVNECRKCELPACSDCVDCDYSLEGDPASYRRTQWDCFFCLHPQDYFTGTFERVKESIAIAYKASAWSSFEESWYFDALAEMILLEREMRDAELCSRHRAGNRYEGSFCVVCFGVVREANRVLAA